MVAILRNARTTHLPICDIHILIATSPHTTGVARREQSGPCRSWIRFWPLPGPHSLPTQTLSLRLAAKPSHYSPATRNGHEDTHDGRHRNLKLGRSAGTRTQGHRANAARARAHL